MPIEIVLSGFTTTAGSRNLSNQMTEIRSITSLFFTCDQVISLSKYNALSKICLALQNL